MDTELSKLRQEIAQLGKRIEELMDYCQRSVKSLHAFDLTLKDHNCSNDDRITEMGQGFARLITATEKRFEVLEDRFGALEYFVHPNAAEDVMAIHKIIDPKKKPDKQS